MDRNEAKLILENYLYELSNQTGSELCRKKYEAIQEAIKALEQPEIIYCKNCEWYKTHFSWNCKKHYYCARESITATIKTENDFCSKAERRTDEHRNNG